ncbi:MAG: class I SAM-dependent rRNA methyltransferase [Lachnospiraceae bacterium]|nr:class I SAM-dependent rRNA methyltransferase [Lachnospiraceae bacterium]
MSSANNTIVTLKKGEGRTIKAGGAWIFDNEIDTIRGTFKNGDIVSIEDFDGYPMGSGFINQNSKIRIRMLSRKKDTVINNEFLRERVRSAWNYRKATMSEADLNACRIIFGEADFLPGLVIDKYNDVLVVESLALGIDKLKNTIVDILVELLNEDGYIIRGVYERSDAPVRKKEGLMPYKGYFEKYADFDTNVDIVENGVKYVVDVVNGQKTGFFLDQKYNRLAMQKLCKQLKESVVRHENTVLAGKDNSNNSVISKIKVLDCFTHMGTFALNCGLALGEYGEVTGLDISEYAVSQATENARRNNLQDTVHFRCANVLDELPKLNDAGEKYDVLILDPPAFTKSKEATKNAIKGYREINMKGIRLVKDGGYFATCSCSHFMTQELFTRTIGEAAKAVHRRLRQIEFRTQASDHPILWAADESYYLKFYIFQVTDEK